MASAWRDLDVCLRLRPSLKVAFAVTENRQLGAKLVPTRHTIRQWCRAAPRVVHELPFSTIYPQPEAAKRPVRGDALCITVIVGAHKPRFSPFHVVVGLRRAGLRPTRQGVGCQRQRRSLPALSLFTPLCSAVFLEATASASPTRTTKHPQPSVRHTNCRSSR